MSPHVGYRSIKLGPIFVLKAVFCFKWSLGLDRPFFDGNEVDSNEQSARPDQCAFKKLTKAQDQDPSVVDIKDGGLSPPDGWAAPGRTNKMRVSAVYVPHLESIARNDQSRHRHAEQGP